MQGESPVTTALQGHVFLIGLNRPKKLNAFSLNMLEALSAAYTAYEQNEEARCALLFANGENFTAGLDLAEVGPAFKSGVPLFPTGQIDPLDMFEPRRTKPVVCAVSGWCLTIGMELLMASDIRIAARGTRFSQLEVQRGIMPFGGATLRFHQLTGWSNAMRYMLTGERFDADEALRIGLVSEVVEQDTLLTRGEALARAVAQQAPLAVKATRESALLAAERGAEAAIEGLLTNARGLMDSEDAVEGVRSFVERREAVFKGK